MKQIIRIEELALTAGSIYLISLLHLNLSWWVYLLLFFTPDIGIAGYLINNKAGAILYNLFHHKAIAMAVIFTGIVAAMPLIIFSGLILLAHSSFDRIMGYGLKYFTGFNDTHLGTVVHKK